MIFMREERVCFRERTKLDVRYKLRILESDELISHNSIAVICQLILQVSRWTVGNSISSHIHDIVTAQKLKLAEAALVFGRGRGSEKSPLN